MRGHLPGLASEEWRAVLVLRDPPLELKRALEVEGRMAADGIIEGVDVSADGGCRVGPALEDGAPDEFALQRFEEGFDHRVIVAVSLARHRNEDAMPPQFGLVLDGAVLARPGRPSKSQGANW